MIRAYDSDYLFFARNSLGRMCDFAAYNLGYNLDDFFDLFIKSGLAYKFSRGDITTINKSGYELALEVLNLNDLDIEITFSDYSFNRSEKYWLGYYLAYYQWYSNLSFEFIIDKVSINELLLMYDKYHEMDIMHFVEYLNKIIFKSNKLKYFRKKRKLTQKELAILTNIPLRSIQQYEQDKKDLSKANASYLIALSNVLYCEVQNLI